MLHAVVNLDGRMASASRAITCQGTSPPSHSLPEGSRSRRASDPRAQTTCVQYTQTVIEIALSQHELVDTPCVRYE
jgi:hypothetical protein